MENLNILVGALEYIEANLTESIKTEDISDFLYCSKSTIEKLFKYYNEISIRDYMIRRRMSKAASEIAKYPEKSFLEIGMKYGYGSNEAFTRAFSGVWHISPSEFRKNPAKYELFPGLRLDRELMEDKSMNGRKKVDISELYDVLIERSGCCIIAGDIVGLVPINDISIQAGDQAIITSLNRMEDAAGDDDLVFRVGGDEFVIITNTKDMAYAESIKKEILKHNGEEIDWEGHKIPLSLYITCSVLEGRPLRYSELFTRLQNEITDHKADIY